MAERGTPFKGVLFAGLMITAEGPKLIEYNVPLRRPRDAGADAAPEVGPAGSLLATADGGWTAFELRWHDDAALTVVMAANGYPGHATKGTEIRGLDEPPACRGRRDLPRRHDAKATASSPTAAAC